MALFERMKQRSFDKQVTETHPVKVPEQPVRQVDAISELKMRIHRKLLDKIDFKVIETIPRGELTFQVRSVIESLFDEEDNLRVGFNRDRFTAEILNEVFGLGPLEPLINDNSISDILVNTHSNIYVERNGKLEKTDVVFKDDDHLLHIIDRIVSRVGRRIDESSPMVDARLPDGSRVNAIIKPLALDGPMLSIRKFSVKNLKMEELINFGTITEPMAELIIGIVKARLNVIISGGTGSGKTTFLNVMSSHIPPDERIITIEDAAELQLQQEHVIRLETRPPNIEGHGEIVQRDLVKNALRMRPDRIIVGEVRGAETIDMLQAMNTGHDGSMTTVHANSPRDALRRIETMILMGTNISYRAMREQISSSINVVIHLARLSDGSRKVIKFTEITGMEGEIVSMQDIFVFRKYGIGEDGKVLGEIAATGIRPKFADILAASGIELRHNLFDENYKVDL